MFPLSGFVYLSSSFIFGGQLLLLGLSLSSADPWVNGLMDPQNCPLFYTPGYNYLDPQYVANVDGSSCKKMYIVETEHFHGIVDRSGNNYLSTKIWGYTDNPDQAYTPGTTIEVKSGQETCIEFENLLPKNYVITNKDGTLPVLDRTIQWPFRMRGYENYNIENNGVPVTTHLHGSVSEAAGRAKPTSFFTLLNSVTGPDFMGSKSTDPMDQKAGTLWYHDDTMGTSRINVYAGLAGFEIVRDDVDTGKPNNQCGLPVYPHENALMIKDHLFKEDGELFYPAFAGDPVYNGVIEPRGDFPFGQASLVTDVFGDHMCVNGIIWPYFDCQNGFNRFRLLNACDSRTLVVQLEYGNGNILPFQVIGSDHGFVNKDARMLRNRVVIENGARVDILVDFQGLENQNVYMMNYGGDAPFTGLKSNPQTFEHTDRTKYICEFRVFDNSETGDDANPDFSCIERNAQAPLPQETSVRRVALFNASDEYGRKIPVMGTVDAAKDLAGDPIVWPNDAVHQQAGLAGQPMMGSMSWHCPTTEIVAVGSTEEWHIFNVDEIAHPIHLHNGNFEVVGRKLIDFTSTTVVDQALVMPNGQIGSGGKIVNPTAGPDVEEEGYVESGSRDTVTALPGQITIIRTKFTVPGEYAWHCHNLPHKDHSMMRPVEVVDVAKLCSGGNQNSLSTAALCSDNSNIIGSGADIEDDSKAARQLVAVSAIAVILGALQLLW